MLAKSRTSGEPVPPASRPKKRLAPGAGPGCDTGLAGQKSNLGKYVELVDECQDLQEETVGAIEDSAENDGKPSLTNRRLLKSLNSRTATDVKHGLPVFVDRRRNSEYERQIHTRGHPDRYWSLGACVPGLQLHHKQESGRCRPNSSEQKRAPQRFCTSRARRDRTRGRHSRFVDRPANAVGVPGCKVMLQKTLRSRPVD
jgi:hypothetical protein